MATFTAACYDDQGNMTMTDTDKVQLMADKASMTTTVATMTTTVATMTTAAAVKDATISTLQADKTTLEADKTTMTTAAAAKDATISTLRTAKEAAEQDGAAKAATIEAKDVLIVDQEANLSEESEEKMPTWAIGIIAVIGAVLFLVIAILGVVVSRRAPRPRTPCALVGRACGLFCDLPCAVPQGAARQAGLRAEEEVRWFGGRGLQDIDNALSIQLRVTCTGERASLSFPHSACASAKSNTAVFFFFVFFCVCSLLNKPTAPRTAHTTRQQ